MSVPGKKGKENVPAVANVPSWHCNDNNNIIIIEPHIYNFYLIFLYLIVIVIIMLL